MIGKSHTVIKCLQTISCLLILASCTNHQPQATLAIKNVNIVDPVHRQIIPHQTVLLRDSTIWDVVENDSQTVEISDSLTIDGTDKYLISGFWNMHTHICWKDDLNEALFPFLLSYGITGVRDMGGDLQILNRFKEQIRKDPASGPDIYGPGPLLDGEHPIHPDFSAPLTDANLTAVLDSLYEGNADFFKVYSLLPKNIVEKIASYCEKRDISFAGHVSEYISPLEAAALHQKSLEHLNRIEDIRDTVELNDFIQAVKTNKTWLCPTLIVYQRKVDLAEGKNLYYPLYEDIDDILKSEWQLTKDRRAQASSSPEKILQLKATFASQKQLVKLLYDEGLPMLIGSDFGGMAFVYPGYSFHEEMALLSELGINPYDILKMATYNPALFWGLSASHGSIEKGKIADLVLLEGNPVENMKNTLKITEVFRHGKRSPSPKK